MDGRYAGKATAARKVGTWMTRLLVTDFDRTLYVNSDISKRNRDALKLWKASGYLYAVATGRNEKSIRDKLGEYGLAADYLICNNGARIVAWDGSVLFHHEIEIKTALAVVEELSKRYPSSQALTVNDSRIQVAKPGDSILYAELTECISPEDCKKIQEGVLQIHKKLENLTQAAETANLLMRHYPAITAVANEWNLDIVSADVDKSDGIDQLMEWIDVSDSPVVIGDSNNDIGMIRRFRGYTLASAREEIKMQASHICKDVADCIRQELSYEI